MQHCFKKFATEHSMQKNIYVFFITDFYIVFLKISVLVFFDIFMSKLLNYNFLFLN